jgi:tetratricopeptide (TPR) repeat protein
MIATAFVSGRRGKAIYRQGELFYSLNYDGASSSVAPAEFAEVLAPNGEFEAIQDVTLDVLQHHLERSTQKHNSLFLILSLLDLEIALSTRVMAAQTVSELLQEEYITKFVRDRLFSRPLPVAYRSVRHEALRPLSSFSDVHNLLREVFECQSMMDEVLFGWNEAAQDESVDSDTLQDIECSFSDSGIFYEIVQAILKRDVQQFNSLIIQQATNLSSRFNPSLKRFLLLFRSKLQSKLFAVRAVGKQGRLRLVRSRTPRPARSNVPGSDFISSLIENLDTLPSPDRQLSAWEAKSRVDKQIGAIREMLFAGRNPQAEKYVQELLQFQLESGDREHAAMSLCSLVAISLDANQMDMADRLSQYAMQLTSEDPVVYTSRAEVLKQRGHFQAALNAYQEAKDRFPNEPYAFDGYADVLSEMGRYQEAIKQYKEAQARFPDEPVAYNGEVSVLRAQGELRKAVKAAVNNTKQFPEDAVTRGNLAGCLSMIGKSDEATRHYEHAISLAPSNIRLLNGYCFNLKAAGRAETALRTVETYLFKSPKSAALLLLKGRLLEANGRINDAIKIYDSIVQQRPGYTPAIYGGASARILIGQVNEALALLPQTGMESEGDWIGYRSLALAFVRSGDVEEAARKIQFGIQNCPWLKERTRLETALGLVELQRNRASQATFVLQKNLQRIDNRYQQTRLLFLGHAQAERGEKDVSRLLLTRIFNSRDSELNELREDIVKKYGLGGATETINTGYLDNRIFAAELKLAMAA